MATPEAKQTNATSTDAEGSSTVHYLGIALIIISLILLFCWMGKQSRRDYYTSGKPQFVNGVGGAFLTKSPALHLENETRPHVILPNDSIRKTAASTVRSKWASTSSTDTPKQGYEVSPLSASDPNSGVIMSATNNFNDSAPQSGILSDGVITPGLSASASVQGCASVTSAIINLADDEIENGIPYYGSNNNFYVSI